MGVGEGTGVSVGVGVAVAVGDGVGDSVGVEVIGDGDITVRCATTGPSGPPDDDVTKNMANTAASAAITRSPKTIMI